MAECHFIDTVISGDVNSTPVVTLLNGIAQGTTTSTRVGNRVYMEAVEVRLHITNETGSTDRLNQMRAILVLDTQANGSTLTVPDVLTSTSLVAFEDLYESDRFVILYDKVLPLNFYGSATVSPAATMHWFYKVNEMVEHHAEFKGTGATASDIATGSLWLMYFGPDAATSGDFDVEGAARVLYYDQ